MKDMNECLIDIKDKLDIYGRVLIYQIVTYQCNEIKNIGCAEILLNSFQEQYK